MRPRGIQFGPFAAHSTEFVEQNFHFFTYPPIINHFLLLQREGLKIGKSNSYKVNETKGFLTLGHIN